MSAQSVKSPMSYCPAKPPASRLRRTLCPILSLVSLVLLLACLPAQAFAVDWTVSGLSISDNTVDAGAQVVFAVTVANVGSENAAATTLQFYWSTDGNLGPGDTLLCTATVPALAAGASNSVSQSCQIPLQLLALSRYLAFACVVSSSAESNTGNNCAPRISVYLNKIDWRVSDPSIDNNNILFSQTVTVTTIVENAGAAAAPATTLRLYWSKNSSISTTTDTPLCAAGVAVPALASGANSGSISQSCQVPPAPPNIQPTYYVGACVATTAFEDETGNNCSGVAVSIVDYFDFSVLGTISVSPTMVDFDDTMSLGATVQNTGTEAASATTLRFYWSEDSTIATTDTPLCTAGVAVPALAASANSGSLSQDCTVPPSQTPGATYYVGACAAILVGELSATNNCSAGLAVSIAVSYFDFSVLGTISVSPTMVEFDDTIALDATVQNTGTAAAAATTLRFYWSDDSSITTTDTPLCTAGVAVPALAAAANSGSLSQSCPIPTAQTIGATYYVGACVPTSAEELNAENNCSDGVAVSITYFDWTVRRPNPSDTTLDLDQTFTLSTTVENEGTGQAGATTLRFYWSEDTIISTADTPLCTAGVSVPALAAGSGSSLSQDCMVPPSQTPETTYYVGACVATVVGEHNTANNCSLSNFVGIISFDLSVDTPSVGDTTLDLDQTFTISATVRNRGSKQAAGATTLRFYWSEDTSITTADSALCTAGLSVPALAAAANSGSLSQDCTVPPSQTPEATYYVGACVATVVGESNAANNCSGGVAVTLNSADWIVSQPSVDDNTVDSDATITLDATVQNTGTAAASATTLRFYWSDDSSITTTDTPLCTAGVAVPALAAAANSGSLSQSCPIPTAQTIGATYYVGACVATSAEELNAENNCSDGVAVSINTFDWTVRQPSVDDTTLGSDQTFTISTMVENEGAEPAGATTLRFYWSEDASISTTDSALCTAGVAVAALAAGGNSSSLSQDCTVPASQTIGATYYVGACVATAVGESNAANNCSVGVAVSINTFDWVVQGDISVDNTVGGSETISIATRVQLAATVQNSATEAASATTLRFYWSEDDSISTADTALCTTGVAVPALAAGSSQSLSQDCPVPPSQTLGTTYYVGACVVTVPYEEDAGNNCSDGVAVSITIQYFDWRVQGDISLSPDMVEPDGTLTLATTVQNAGTAAAAATTVSFYWSEDASISTADVMLCTAGVTVPALSAGSASSLSQDCVVPASQTAGATYYVGACVATVSEESDAANNCSVGVAVRIKSSAVMLDLTSDTVDVIDATLLLRGIRLTQGQRNSIVSGQTSNIVAAGYQNLLAGEADIVSQIDALLNTDPPVLDLTGDNVVDIIDATLLLRGIRLTKSQRASLVSGETSNIVVAGYANLLESEAAIVTQISDLLGE